MKIGCIFAFSGGVILGLIEGVGILMTKFTADQFMQGNDRSFLLL